MPSLIIRGQQKCRNTMQILHGMLYCGITYIFTLKKQKQILNEENKSADYFNWNNVSNPLSSCNTFSLSRKPTKTVHVRRKPKQGKKQVRKKVKSEGETEPFMLLWFCSSVGNKIGIANFWFTGVYWKKFTSSFLSKKKY